jgi:hypothetical protein
VKSTLDWDWRWVPGHLWVRVTVVWNGAMEPGHGWMYQGIVRRDAWRLGRFGLAVLRLPKVSTMQ